ncbi:MAG: TrmH family RNA methyltransferase [Anaerolineae bacterium]
MVEVITSLQNQYVKLANQLQNRARARRKEGKIVLEGTRLIGDALAQLITPEYVFYQPTQVDYELIAQLQNTRATLYEVTDEIMQHVSDTQNPQGIVAVFRLPRPSLPPEPQRVLILDAVQDPGNMGTILRTAGAAGVQVVILAPGCVDPYNPKVLRSGMGAHFRLPVIEADWANIRGYCDDLATYLARGDAETRYSDVDWTQAWALVISNEAHGGSQDAERFAEQGVSIPMANAESLNAAIATGVLLFEAQRQWLTQST